MQKCQELTEIKMPRMPRVLMKGVLYYITSKSGHEEDLFMDSADYLQYISLIDSYKKQYGFKLFAYVLMPKHLHLLIEPKTDAGISNIMHDINSRYTKAYNSRYDKTGHLFQERFKAVIAEKPPYLLPLTRHISIHPKTSKIVEDPKDYPYSSYVKFLDPAKRDNPDLAEEIEEVFKALQGREDAFEKYVTGADPEEIKEFKKFIRKNRILGSKEFGNEVKKAMTDAVKQYKKPAAVNRKQFIYVVAGSIAVLVVVIAIANNYRRQNIALMSAYDKTLEVYDKTLEMLKRERSVAVKTEKGAEDVEWKISLVESAVEKLQKEQKELDGYTWNISLTQVSGPSSSFAERDTLMFEAGRVESAALARDGFLESSYSKRESKSGFISWDTMQTNSRGETASWHGKWDGKVMRGILSRRSADGTVRDFSFASTGERVKR